LQQQIDRRAKMAEQKIAQAEADALGRRFAHSCDGCQPRLPRREVIGERMTQMPAGTR
jgi:hypothetical protein